MRSQGGTHRPTGWCKPGEEPCIPRWTVQTCSLSQEKPPDNVLRGSSLDHHVRKIIPAAKDTEGARTMAIGMALGHTWQVEEDIFID